ncbi:MAG TPA: hypothetical protein VKS25_07515 [Solirubrobacteraceae bacterium]|nr:hypothetical protein [Solirubrobacteraceae bacterium]
MSGNLQIVFSHLPEAVTDEEFCEWYDAHLPEILSIPGFVSAQRFRLEPVVTDGVEPTSYRYLALYEIEGDTETLLAEMEKRRFGTVDSYAARKDDDASGPPLPEWWERARFASWNCVALGERITADSLRASS